MNKVKAILTIEIAKLYVNSCARTVSVTRLLYADMLISSYSDINLALLTTERRTET
jgi:hypothetical protein